MQVVPRAPRPMRLGELLISRQVVTVEDLDRALELQKERGEKIGKILVDAGLVSREKRGLWVWYRVVPERLAQLRAVLA